MLFDDSRLSSKTDAATGGLIGSRNGSNYPDDIRILPSYCHKDDAFLDMMQSRRLAPLDDQLIRAVVRVQAVYRGYRVRKWMLLNRPNPGFGHSRRDVLVESQKLETQSTSKAEVDKLELLQREMEDLRKQVDELRVRKMQDEMIISMKSKEIETLKNHSGPPPSVYGGSQNTSVFQADTEPTAIRALAKSKRPFIRSHTIAGSAPATQFEGHVLNSSTSSKSIWGSDFGLFSDVISQPSSERAFSTNGSEFGATSSISASVGNSTQVMSSLEDCRPLWNSWNPSMKQHEVPQHRTSVSVDGSFFSSNDGVPLSACSTNPDVFVAGEVVNYNYLVDRIVRTNDQPISLFLQQKLQNTRCEKTKSLIFEAITLHAVMLMKNRFGNFLMQKCFECGTPEQVRAVVEKMKQNVLELACDRFGCHVVQKAVEFVEEDQKVVLASEMFQRTRETITHRFASHVWQRIFEIKWKTPLPVLLEKVNSTLTGHWATIANDEHGSLVVQCIFENADQSEKYPIINEILLNVQNVAKGQWGNYVIQHILEHGDREHRAMIIAVLTRDFFAMSLDQYASKVVEKGLKIAAKKDLHILIDQVLVPGDNKHHGRPCILDMMNHQYANYVVQHILSLADKHQRHLCTRMIIPHVPALRSSKYGQRVAAIIEKQFRGAPANYANNRFA